MTTKKYYYAVGRRKETTAVVKLFPAGTGKYLIRHNDKDTEMSKFFGGATYLFDNAIAPFKILSDNAAKSYDAEITISGGGIMGISDAIKLGFSRALIEETPTQRTTLKPYGCLRRDARIKERKKFGLKKARKRPTRSKR